MSYSTEETAARVYAKMEARNSAGALGKPVSAVSRVHEVFGRAHALSSRVQNLVNRIVGAVPEPATGRAEKLSSITDDILPGLADSADGADEAMRRADDALDRLERALP